MRTYTAITTIRHYNSQQSNWRQSTSQL